MRICFFGDSFVHGTGDDEGLGWVGRVIAHARGGGRDVTAYNLGIRRNTSADIAARWRAEAQLRLPSDCDGRLVFSFGANDCAANEAQDGPRVAPAESLAHAELILESARQWLPTLMIGPGIIADHHEATLRVSALSLDYAALCARLGIPYLDISRLLLSSPIWSQEALAGDGAHPNSGGYALVAEAVSNWRAWREWLEAAE